MLRHKMCPRCNSKEIVRSHRRGIERILFFLKPYRCQVCQHRYYALQSFSVPTKSM